MNESIENENNAQSASSERSSNLKFLALVILVAGLGLAAFLYPHRGAGDGSTDGDPANADAPLSLQDSRRDSRELEIYSGKFGLLMDKWVGIGHAWMQPKPLAITIALASGIAAFGVFSLASRTAGKTRR